MVRLISSENQTFDVPEQLTMLSSFIKTFIDEHKDNMDENDVNENDINENSILLPIVNTFNLTKVIEFFYHFDKEPYTKIPQVNSYFITHFLFLLFTIKKRLCYFV